MRWTERRNLACFLDLIARNQLEVASLVSGIFPLTKATQVYADLSSGALAGAVGVLLEYPAPDGASEPPATSQLVPGGRPAGPRPAEAGQLAVGFIGAGNYATSMLLPHLAKLDTVRLAHVATNRVAVGGQRPAAVRLRHRLDRRGRRARATSRWTRSSS